MLFSGVVSMRPCQCSNVYTLILILLLLAANLFSLPIFPALSYFFSCLQTRKRRCLPACPACWRFYGAVTIEGVSVRRITGLSARYICCRKKMPSILWNLGNQLFSAKSLPFYFYWTTDHWFALWKEKNFKSSSVFCRFLDLSLLRIRIRSFCRIYILTFSQPETFKLSWNKTPAFFQCAMNCDVKGKQLF
jgi:hypothetical protein